MKRKSQIIASAILLIILLWAIIPWLVPAYNHDLMMTVQLLNSKDPAYEVRLRNLTPWPVILTEAQWLVTHNARYSFWVTSEAPKQDFWLLPYQSHVFQFTIYNDCPTEREYFNGSLSVELHATIHVIGSTSQIRISTPYNSTLTVPSTRIVSGISGGNC